MNKTELAKELKLRCELKNQDVAVEYTDTIIEIIKDTLRKGEGVDLAGFGKFGIKPVEESTKSNPQTQAKVTVPAHNKPTFKYMGGFADEIKGRAKK